MTLLVYAKLLKRIRHIQKMLYFQTVASLSSFGRRLYSFNMTIDEVLLQSNIIKIIKPATNNAAYSK